MAHNTAMTNQDRRLNVMDTFGSGRKFLTFGGIETYLIFQQKFPLRSFAAFEVFSNDKAFAELEKNHLRPIAETARQHGFGLVFDCLVYKATPDCIAELGYGPGELAGLNRTSVEHMAKFAAKWRSATGKTAQEVPILLSGDLGPRGDGYGLGDDQPLTVEAARDYHRHQISALAQTEVDMLTALSMTSSSEAIGIVLAAKEFDLPIIVSPTVETDGALPDNSHLSDFIQRVDAATDGYPLFFQVNCAHPLHLQKTLSAAASANMPWLSRFKGVRANASSKSHAELNESPTLDRGDPVDLAARMAELDQTHSLLILGGCCGTDADHINEIAKACAPKARGI